MNRWGNDDHGPGGDPSWLGGRDRDDQSGSTGWNSDFGSDDQKADSDFASSGSTDFGWTDPQTAEEMAPRFGDRGRGDPLPLSRDEDSPWNRDFTDRDENGRDDSPGSKVAAVLPKIVTTVISIIAAILIFKIFFGGFGGSNGFGGIFPWWILLVFGLPLLRKLGRIFRGRGD